MAVLSRQNKRETLIHIFEMDSLDSAMDKGRFVKTEYYRELDRKKDEYLNRRRLGNYP